MAIQYKMLTTLNKVESRFDLNLKRERQDIAKLLQNIKNGDRLESLFPRSIMESIKKQFIEKGYIDSEQRLQTKGLDFIDNPYYKEEETGIYSIQFANVGDQNQDLIVKMDRKLANQESSKCEIDQNFFMHNEIIIGENENIIIEGLKNTTNFGYKGKSEERTITFNLCSKSYNAGYGEKLLGDKTSNVILNNAFKKFSEDFNYLMPVENFSRLRISNLKDIDFKSLVSGKITKGSDNFEIISHPLFIDDLFIATEYAYLYMYNKIITDGQYLEYTEMNEMFENEVLSFSMLSKDVKDQMVGFNFTKEGFKKYLSKDKFEHMFYKLRVIDELLNIKIDNNSNLQLRTYFDLAKYVANNISPKNVDKLDFVMGYAFVDNKKNNIISCVEAFQEYYPNIQIVRKNDGSNQKEDENLKLSVKDHKVDIKTNKEIGSNFHDRFIVFEMKDGTVKTMLVTCEIAQFFNLNTGDTLGSIINIPNNDVIKNNKSLIQMIKEAR